MCILFQTRSTPWKPEGVTTGSTGAVQLTPAPNINSFCPLTIASLNPTFVSLQKWDSVMKGF